jgi:hypothetical protein
VSTVGVTHNFSLAFGDKMMDSQTATTFALYAQDSYKEKEVVTHREITVKRLDPWHWSAEAYGLLEFGKTRNRALKKIEKAWNAKSRKSVVNYTLVGTEWRQETKEEEALRVMTSEG